MIYSIVKRFSERGYEQEDLYQIAVIGFIKSIKRFDTNFDVKLSTYAVPYILGELKRFIRDDGPIKVSRSMKELGIKVKEVQKEELRKTGKELKIEEIAKILKVSKEDVGLAIDAFVPPQSIYEKKGLNDEDGISIVDTIASKVDEANLVTTKVSIQALIGGLEEKEKNIILLRYYQGKTQMQVAKILGITQVQVSRMEKKILNSMRTKLAM